MNFSRVMHAIFKGKGEDQGNFRSCHVYLVPCLYPSDVHKWYSTVVNDRLEIHLLPSALLFLRVSFSLLPFPLPLPLLFPSALVIESPGARIGLESGA